MKFNAEKTLSFDEKGLVTLYDIYKSQINVDDVRNVIVSKDTILDGELLSLFKNLDTVILEDGTKEISKNMFYDCRFLREVIIPKDLQRIESGAFYGCECLTDITIPDTVTTIGDGAFAYTGLSHIEIPDGVKEISYRSFSNSCLKSIKLPENLMSIGSHAFEHTKLVSVDIPDSCKIIGFAAFYACGNLEDVKLPKNLGVIERDAFGSCSKYKPNFSKNLPGLLISKHAFLNEVFPFEVTVAGQKFYTL